MSIDKVTIAGTGRTNPGIKPERGNDPKYEKIRWIQQLFDNFTGDVQWVRLKHKPVEPTLNVFQNGILQRLDIDYTFNDRTVTFIDPLASWSNVLVEYNQNSVDDDQTGDDIGYV